VGECKIFKCVHAHYITVFSLNDLCHNDKTPEVYWLTCIRQMSESCLKLSCVFTYRGIRLVLCFLGIDTGPQQWGFPAVHLLLSDRRQLQLLVIFVHISTKHNTKMNVVINRAHSFPPKILPNSAGQLTRFRGSPRQNRPYSAARQSLPFMTENWKSCSETSVIEGWHCTKGRYALAISTALRIGLKVC